MTQIHQRSGLSVEQARLRSCQKCLLYFACVVAIFQLNTCPVSNAAPGVLNNLSTNTATSSESKQLQLQTIVQEAVNSSIQLLGDSTNLTTQLVNNIVEKLQDAGVSIPKKCLPLSAEQLVQKFYERNTMSESVDSCLLMDKMTTGPGLMDDAFFLKTNSSCRDDIHIDAVCFETEAQCSVSTSLQRIAANSGDTNHYFPQYKLELSCGGCSQQDNACIEQRNNCFTQEAIETFYPLKLVQGACDENGYEDWILDRSLKQNTIVACGCQQVL